MQNNLEIGERIRKIREEMHMSREVFSEKVDISEVFLGQVERGERLLSIKTLSSIISYTGVSADYFLFGDSQSLPTKKRINRILDNSTDETVEFIYNLIRSTHSFVKKINNLKETN
jgi:transcriptional regulator with XRE-family HTH domain